MNPLHIAISGASGLIGSELCRRLGERGHRVSRLIRRGSSDSCSRPESDLEWDPFLGLSQPQRLESMDALIHLAGRSIADHRWTTAEKQRIRDSRVAATQRLAWQIASLENPPPIVMSASAIGIYGDCGDRAVDESEPPADDFLGSVAHGWETACAVIGKTSARVIHPRFGMVLSPSGGALEKMLPLFRWGLGGRLGSGKQVWSWISLDDCVAALIWLLEKPGTAGPYNLVSPNPVSNDEFTKVLARQLGKPAVLPAPEFALRLALGEMADALLFTSCRVQPRRLTEGGFVFDDENFEDYLYRALG